MTNLIYKANNLIANGETEKAIDYLMSMLQDKSAELHKRVIVISAMYRNLKKSYFIEMIPTIEMNKINHSLVELIAEFEQEVEFMTEFLKEPTLPHISDDVKILYKTYIEYGNSYLANFEFEMAKESFLKALSIDPNSQDANNGIEICKICFDKPNTEGYIPLDLFQKRAMVLLKKMPDSLPLLLMLSNSEWYLGDNEEAIRICNQVIGISPDYSPAYLQLGYIYQGLGDIKKAKEFYEKSLNYDRKYSFAHNNLGYIFRIERDFEKSIYHLDRAIKLNFNFLTLLNLSDSYRYTRDFDNAYRMKSIAIKFMAQNEKLPVYFLLGDWMYNFMSVKDNEELTNYHILFRTENDKLSLFHFGFSLDCAFLNNIEEADQNFQKSLILDDLKLFNDYYSNQIQSTLELLEIENDSSIGKWMNEKIQMLSKI